LRGSGGSVEPGGLRRNGIYTEPWVLLGLESYWRINIQILSGYKVWVGYLGNQTPGYIKLIFILEFFTIY